MAITDNRFKGVDKEFVELDAHSTYAPDIFYTDKSALVGSGVAFDLPYTGTTTVQTAVDTTGASQVLTAATTAINKKTLTIDQHPVINDVMSRMDKLFSLGGNFLPEFAKRCAIKLANYRDNVDCQFLAGLAQEDTGTLYNINPAGAAVTVKMVEATIGLALNQEGVSEQDINWFCNPMAMAGIRSLPSWQAQTEAIDNAPQNIGVRHVGAIGGVPAYTSQSVPRLLAVATSACTVTTNVGVFTVPLGHPIVPGMKVKYAGMTNGAANLTAQTVTATTATTFTAPYTNGDGVLADGIGTATIQSSFALLLVRPRLFQATSPTVQRDLSLIEQPLSPDDILRLYPRPWGRQGLAGGVFVLGGSAATDLS